MFGTAFNNFEMWKHLEMCATWARNYARSYIEDENMPMAIEKTQEAIAILKRIKEHMFQGRFVDYKTVDDPIEDAIKEMCATLRSTPVVWNSYFVTSTRYFAKHDVTVKAKYIQGEGRWLYPDQLALYDPHFDDPANYRV